MEHITDTDAGMTDADRVLEEVGALGNSQLRAEIQYILDGVPKPRPPVKHRWGFRISMVAAAFVPYTLLWSFAPVEAWTAFGFPAFFVVGAWWLYWQGRGWPHHWLLERT